MKIKRFDNLWLMGLILSASILGVVYLLKLIVPQFVVEVAQIDSIVSIGRYIDTHKWAWYLASFVVSFITYYLTCCACCKKTKLNYKEIIMVIVTILVLFAIREFLPTQYTSANISSIVLLPFLMKADFKATVILFVSTNFLQTITLDIRGLALIVTDYNFATSLILTIDYYILLSLLYFYFNFKINKENT